jgi:hypothetical protein
MLRQSRQLYTHLSLSVFGADECRSVRYRFHQVGRGRLASTAPAHTLVNWILYERMVLSLLFTLNDLIYLFFLSFIFSFFF